MSEELTKRLAEENAKLQLQQFIPTDMVPERLKVSNELGSSYALLNVLEIPVEFYNPNPRLKTTDCYDCVQRALCKLFDMDWDMVYRELFEIGYESGFMVNSINTITKYASIHGFTTIDLEDGPSGIKLGSFLARHRKGRFAISCCGHMFAYIDGTIYDNRHCIDFIEETLGEYIRFIVCKPDELGYSGVIKEYNDRRLL